MFWHKLSYHCGYCGLYWPLEQDFSRCPSCTTLTSPHRHAPMARCDVAMHLERLRGSQLFHDIISFAGFTDDERRAIRLLEAQLGNRRR